MYLLDPFREASRPTFGLRPTYRPPPLQSILGNSQCFTPIFCFDLLDPLFRGGPLTSGRFPNSPPQELYCPPLTIRVVDCRSFGRFTLVGTHVINSIHKFLYHPVTRRDREAAEKRARAQQLAARRDRQGEHGCHLCHHHDHRTMTPHPYPPACP